MKNYTLVFDDIILNQLKKLGKEADLREIVSKMLDKIEELYPYAGRLLDVKLHIYEVKRKHPQSDYIIRLQNLKKKPMFLSTK